MTDPFADIRPYRDEEVAAVLSALLDNTEFLDALASYRLGKLGSVAAALSRPVVRTLLRREVRDVTDIASMQQVIKGYMDRMIERSTAGFSVSGVEHLDPQQAYLFISNHRDIAMDPAFTNYALHQSGRGTVRIAIGDNLLTKPWVSDLMRLNKSFIVKRSVNGPRELLAASKQLSNYIRHSITAEHSHVWLAQREGRAKDGRDRTEPVIIKMLSMSRDKRTQTFAEHMRELHIVPVAIAYELDPCDALKANELCQLAATGTYEKGAQEDVASIARGISGNKGRVHVAFGSPLVQDFESADEVAAEIDRQIISAYRLHPTNLFAYEELSGTAELPAGLTVADGACSRDEFLARIAALPEPHRPFALKMYANALISKLAAIQSAQTLA
ncbi:MAG: 1-acyl-sn-glycerol-3-phosphate acyltransferase [Gammaproteobacteria bacterium]|nr:1-acyl-sn-glycerol-3-phosphate acyltransferase [Gammaproteobacteria bacterium]